MSTDGIFLSEHPDQARYCAVCHDNIYYGQAAVTCDTCGTAYHAACWQFSNACAALNCAGMQSSPVVIPAPTAVASEQIIIDEKMLDSVLPPVPEIVIEDWDLLEPPPMISLDEKDLAPLPPPPPEVTCVYCHTDIEADQEARVCRSCQMPYHQECWDSLGRCAAWGCASTQSIVYDPSSQAGGLEVQSVTLGEEVSQTFGDKLRRLFRPQQS